MIVAANIADQLYVRAVRMLLDGLTHAPDALQWARELVAGRNPMDQAEYVFTLRELSLGAAEVVSCE